MPAAPGGDLRPLRVLVTQFRLADRSGTELYAFELARALIGLGHQAAIYSPRLGPLAEDARAAGVPVVDDPTLAGGPPDVIHGQHLLATLAAMVAFPTVPVVYLCHDATYWQDTPPPSSRVVRHLAVGEASRRRLVEDGVAEDAVRVIPNWVDLDRFRSRGRLPDRPHRALVFSNYTAHLEVVREACAEMGLRLDIVGSGVAAASSQPWDVLGDYDVVFAKGRCALEALAVGAAVVVCDAAGVGPLVRPDNVDHLRRLNFGAAAMTGDLRASLLVAEVAGYNPDEAAAVSARIRHVAGLTAAVGELVGVYRSVVEAGDGFEEAGEQDRLVRLLVAGMGRVGGDDERVREEGRGIAEANRRLDLAHADLVAEHDRIQVEYLKVLAGYERLVGENRRILSEYHRVLAENEMLTAEREGRADGRP